MLQTFNLLSSNPPEMPKRLPGFLRLATSKVPDIVKPAALNAVFPPANMHMRNISFRYWDNKLHEPTADSEGIIAESAVGKGYIDDLCNALTQDVKARDDENLRKLEEYNRLYNSKSANQAKPERPLDCAIQRIEPDTTNAAFIQLLKDAEYCGNLSLYCNVTEVDMLDQMCGSHKKLSMLIRNMTSKGATWGAHRATANGISGRPTLRWCFNFATVPYKAQQFFRGCIPEGVLWRLGISYVKKPGQHKGSAPRQGSYDEQYFRQLESYLLRLSAATGELTIEPCNKCIVKLREEMEDIADLTDNDTFDSLYKRSLVLAWLKGCVLYIAEGYKWSKPIADFVRWTLYYDIWSKIQIFAPQLKTKEKVTQNDIVKFGPSNMLDKLGESFTRAQLEELRLSLDKPSDASQQLRTWLHRGFITYSAQTGLYAKTTSYMEKHKKVEN